MWRSRVALALLIAPLIASAGCGGSGKTVWVTGKLLKGGAKYVVPKEQSVNVTLVGLEVQDDSGKSVESGEPFWAEVDQENATFSVPGPEGRGIPRGKYRVAVTQKMLREAFDAAHPQPKKGDRKSASQSVNRETDFLGNKFGLGTSPIIREIKGSSELVIDLDKPEG
jgi:hypothetical protein